LALDGFPSVVVKFRKRHHQTWGRDMKLPTKITVAATVWIASIATLLATVSPASASVETVTWYNYSDLSTPITSYDFGNVPLGTAAHADFVVEIDPWDSSTDSASAPTTTAPFSIGTPSGFVICGVPTTYCDLIRVLLPLQAQALIRKI
jgi:hypothetical protein